MSNVSTTGAIRQIMATLQPQPNIVMASATAQTPAMTTPLVGSTARIPTPTRLFGQPAVTMPSTPKHPCHTFLLNAGASNASATTNITNPTFSTPPFTSVTTPPIPTSQPMQTVSNIVNQPTSEVSQAPTLIVPPTSTSVTAPVSTSVAPPFTPVTTTTIRAPTTSNVTHVPSSVPLPPWSYGLDKKGSDQYNPSHVYTALQYSLWAGQPRPATRSGFVRLRSVCDFTFTWIGFISRAGNHGGRFDSIAIYIVNQRWICSSFFVLSKHHHGTALCADVFYILIGLSWHFLTSFDNPPPDRSLHTRRVDPNPWYVTCRAGSFQHQTNPLEGAKL
ncbi:hypothetical protein OUZ56_016475 [Daphnia magna]|uniref:Uncharacterized protein n=1 Tax=Daphnia magna TaxID=35525 RepID=A0ABR0AQM7_9CRUS|nr:hypothetical protein OUZ56_016475 [Daphnia magna]